MSKDILQQIWWKKFLSSILNRAKVYLSTFINLLFPSKCLSCKKRESNFLCEDCLKKIEFISTPYCKICGKKAEGIVVENYICGECRTTKNYFEYARAAAEYRDILKEAIHFFKYRKKENLKFPLSKLLLEYLEICDVKEEILNCDLIIPVPLHKKRLKERRFNQAHLISEILSEELKIPLISDVLIRIKPTLPQINLNKRQRIENIKGAFLVEDKEKVKNKKILLIDDVFTTGSTVRECAKMLKKAGAEKVTVLTLARGR